METGIDEDPFDHDVFARLGSAWPRTLPCRALLDAAPPEAAYDPGEHPRANALARAQLGQRCVPSLACEAIELSTEADGKLFGLLDGTLTRAELAARTSWSGDKLDASLARFARLELMENPTER